MKKKTKKIALAIIIILAAIFLHYTEFACAADDHLIISEILVGGNTADEEFIELYNPTPNDIDIKSLPLKLHIVNSSGIDTSKTLAYTDPNPIIRSREYLILSSSVFKEKRANVVTIASYSAALASNGAIYISTSATKNLNAIDLVCWGSSVKCDFPLPNPKSNYSLERIGNGSDWQESCEAGGTPEKESRNCPDEPIPPAPENEEATHAETSENYSLSDKIYLNEILPNPKKSSDDEYIEITNGESEPVDLRGWKIKDASKSKGYQFKEHEILNPGEYLAIYKPDSKLSLNNSNETVYLFNPQNELVSSATFEKSSKNSSYSFDGQEWKWTKYLTPGKKNEFDSTPTVKINKPKKAFEDIATEFSAKAKDKETKKLKYTWNFGDGKKSYLRKTTHTYLATGKYTVMLTITDDSQTVEKSFAVNVKKSPLPDLEIVKLLPNPTGADTDGEYVDIKNSSGEKVDLKGWKIATGLDKKMFNHPISGELAINSGENKTVTREFSKFSLNNKAGKVQLVAPDGKIIDEVEYSKDPPASSRQASRAGKIGEDEAYVKINGQWQWILPDTKEMGENAEEDEVIDDPTGEIEAAEEEDSENKDEAGEVLGATDEYYNLNNTSIFSTEDAYIFFSNIGLFSSLNKEINFCPLKNRFSLDYLLASVI